MKVLGVVAEYNPFHNGHLYHIKKSKELTCCDYTVCIMSGNFIQRGLPALFNKWVRTEMALKNLVDIVIELPVYYSLASAEFFAYGAIKLLDSLGIVDTLCFGSEVGTIEDLYSIAEILIKEPILLKQLIAEYLDKGLSFPQSRSLALQEYFKKNSPQAVESIKAILTQPNNILGIEYLKALIKLQSPITPFTIRRWKSEYNASEPVDNIASATAIRKILFKGYNEEITNVMPANCFEILNSEITNGRGPVFIDSFESTILAMLRKSDPEAISRIPDVSEGMENRIKKAAQSSGSIPELLMKIKTKRYTLTRIQRILSAALLDLTKKDFDCFNTSGGPQYIRVLGFNSKGKELLSKIKSSSLPIVTAPQDFLRTATPIQSKMLRADILATDIYSLGYPAQSQRHAGQDFFQKIISL